MPKTPFSTLRCVIAVIFAVLIGSTALHAATEVDGRPNNPYGVQLGMSGAQGSDFASMHFQWARDMVGEWGHVRVPTGIRKLDVQGDLRSLVICRAKHLVPVMTGLSVPDEYRTPGGKDQAPAVRDDGYPKAAEQYGSWAQGLAQYGARVPYYEVGNEINGKWIPEAYGKFIIAVSSAMKQIMPDLKVVSAGLAGHGDKFLFGVVDSVPESADAIDFWGLHPYGANRPPSYKKDGYCLSAHLWSAAALNGAGVENPRFVMTESNYELGNKRDGRFARITDELRGSYMVEAYETIWVPDPSVVTLTVYLLQATNYPGWDTIVLVDNYCRKNETYRALAEAPKPQGSDWMPHGDCTVSGTITDAATGRPLEHVFVYTVPGIYAAETDSEGHYTIADVPDGSYQIRMFRDGWVSPSPGTVTLNAGEGTCSAQMKRVGLVTNGFDAGECIASGWEAIDGKRDEHYEVDCSEKRSGNASQKMSARPGDPTGIWLCTAYTTALPDKTYAAEVWVKGKGVKLGDGKGATLGLSITDSGAQPYSTCEVSLPLEGDFDWTPVCATIPPYAKGRRLTLQCKFDAEAGEVWFDDPYCHYADWPVPSVAQLGTGTGAVTGELKSVEDEYLAGAAVWLNPGNYWATTRSDGTFTISGIPAGTYDLRAFRKDAAPVEKYALKIEDGKTLDIALLAPKAFAPTAIQNPGFEHRGPAKEYTPNWTKYGEFDGLPLSGWHPEMPEHPDGAQARTGKAFAGSITNWKIKSGGIYQTIAVEPGKTYEASVWSYTYRTKEGLPGDVVNQIGIDPTGGIDPEGPYVIWTPYQPSHRIWSKISLKTEAWSDRMTVFLGAKQVTVLEFSLNCFDDVAVVEVE